MRSHRVRVRVRTQPKVTKRQGGVITHLNNREGRAQLRERLWFRFKEQNKICAVCGLEMTLENARFRSKEFREDEEPEVIHKECARA